MTYTTITNEGLLMWREDIFATYEEGSAYIEANPLTPNGTPQYLVTTEVALAAQDAWRRLQAEYEVKLREARIAAVAQIREDAANRARAWAADRAMVADMERDGLL
jgi:hypothetical protein